MLRLLPEKPVARYVGECVIHVGTHKTATTAMQRALRANESAFERMGVHVPLAGRTTDHSIAAHHNIAWDLLGVQPFDPAKGTLATLIDELATSNARVICLSSEEFVFLSAYPMTLERMRDELHRAGYRVRIVIYLRPQVDYFESIFGESAKHGPVRPCGAVLGEVLERKRANFWRDGGGHLIEFSYAALLRPFERVFGTENIDVRAYRKTSDESALMADFMCTMTRQPRAVIEAMQTAITSNVGLHFGDLLRALVTTQSGIKFERDACRIDASALKVMIERVDPRYPLEILGLIEIARLIRSFALSNLYVFVRYRVFVGCVSRHRLRRALGSLFHHAANLERRWILMLVEAYVAEVLSETDRSVQRSMSDQP